MLMLRVNLSILGPAQVHWVLLHPYLCMVRISQRKPGLRSLASREHGRHHKLIIIQPRNSGKLKLSPKVTHRTGLGAKFRPQISLVFYRLDSQNTQV